MENRGIVSMIIGITWAIIAGIAYLVGMYGVYNLAGIIALVFWSFGALHLLAAAIADFEAMRREDRDGFPHDDVQ